MVLCAIRLIRQLRADHRLGKSDRPEKVILYFDKELRKDIKRALAKHSGRCNLPQKILKVLRKSQAFSNATANGSMARPIKGQKGLERLYGLFFNSEMARSYAQRLLYIQKVPAIWWEYQSSRWPRGDATIRMSALDFLYVAAHEVCDEYLTLLERKDPDEAIKIYRRSSYSSCWSWLSGELKIKWKGKEEEEGE